MEARPRLFSSPSRSTMQAEALVILSSSPDFPSINELLPKREKKPLIRSGSRAAPIPETATRSFTTASHFWHTTLAEENSSADIDEGHVARHEGEKSHAKSPRLVLGDVVSDGMAAQIRVPPQNRGTTANPPEQPLQEKPAKGATRRRPKTVVACELVEELGLSLKEMPSKKGKGKDTTNGQTKMPKGKITKPSAAKSKPTKQRAETVNKHFVPAVAPESIDIDDDPVVLEPALKRRIDWTPTKNTEPPIVLLDSSIVKDVASPRPSFADMSPPPGEDIFKNLRDTFSCANHEIAGPTAATLEQPTDVFGKRKLIEMVTTSKMAESKTPEVSPVKQKAPKKKPRTITDLATAAYRIIDITEDTASKEQSRGESLLDDVSTNAGSVSARTAKVTAATRKAIGTQAGSMAKPKRVTKKKAVPPQPILLSPESAMRQVSRQDFVFGTSSQLATEVDAGLLRDIHQAMQNSNRREEHDPWASSPIDRTVSRKSSGRRLWGAGARGVDGDLLEVEVIDLVDSPAPDMDLTNPAVILSLAADTARVQEGESSGSRSGAPLIEVDVVTLPISLTPTHPRPHISFTQKQHETNRATSVPAAANSNASHQSFVQLAETTHLDEDPPASNQEQYHQMVSSVPDASMPAPPEAPAPKYELYTDAQLAKEVQSYGFKPIKKRTAAIALLVQCWSSKNQSKAQTMGRASTASISTSSAPAAPKAKASSLAPVAPKPRGRPPKTAAFIAEASGSSAASSATTVAPQPAPKRPRGRPKKDAVSDTNSAAKSPTKAATKLSSLSPIRAAGTEPTPGPSTPKRKRTASSAQPAAIEIADSDQDDELDPFFDLSSSAASSAAPANEFSSPVPGVELSMTEADDSVLSLTSSPTSQQARLFGYITDAVRTAPRSRDPENPSWHEKMLMYDPVVLEDLTAWLNAGQLDRVGFEEEVSCGDVKKWCESKSVCCLWKVNINGKERKRF